MREQLDIERHRTTELIEVVAGIKKSEEEEEEESEINPQLVRHGGGWGAQQARLKVLVRKRYEEQEDKGATKET